MSFSEIEKGTRGLKKGHSQLCRRCRKASTSGVVQIRLSHGRRAIGQRQISLCESCAVRVYQQLTYALTNIGVDRERATA